MKDKDTEFLRRCAILLSELEGAQDDLWRLLDEEMQRQGLPKHGGMLWRKSELTRLHQPPPEDIMASMEKSFGSRWRILLYKPPVFEP